MDGGGRTEGVTAAVRQRAARVRMVALDVDGTMTDGTIWIGPTSETMKGFSVRDGFGLALLREAGVRLAIVTGRESSIVAVRAAELHVDVVAQRVADKARTLRECAERFGLSLEEVAYMGDDWPDLAALAVCGFAAAPADAAAPVRAAAHWVSSRPGGHGAVREFAEFLLDARGALEPLLSRHRQGAAA